jgi:hypothetical protein
MSCFKSNKTLYDCDATVYSYLLFVGAGWLALVPSRLPHLRQLCLKYLDNICYEFVEKLKAAAPELKVI